MTYSPAHDALKDMASDICENQDVVNAVNALGPLVAGAATTAVAGPLAGKAVSCGLKGARALDKQKSAQFMVELGLSVTLPLLAPLIAVALIFDALTEALDE